ncbi:MAG: hypothetical protein LYZ70_04825 [Nitrososphaerales archaeon]|nr:hypothetical protein [Nitrososphaerales archaeon]
MAKLSSKAKTLAGSLGVYIIFDVLLTPVGGLETRPPSDVTTAGFASVGLLFAGLILAAVSIWQLFSSPRRASGFAIVGAIFYFPAFFADETGLFSMLRPPDAIAGLEAVQAVVAIIVIVLAVRARSESPVKAPPG